MEIFRTEALFFLELEFLQKKIIKMCKNSMKSYFHPPANNVKIFFTLLSQVLNSESQVFCYVDD